MKLYPFLTESQYPLGTKGLLLCGGLAEYRGNKINQAAPELSSEETELWFILPSSVQSLNTEGKSQFLQMC